MKPAQFKTILLEQKGKAARIILNRPEVHNAFNSAMISELHDAFEKIKESESARIVILTGKGKSFCAGADLNWLREIKGYSFEQNLKESLELAELLHRIYTLPKPTLARVNGTAIGGGTGLVAACDIAVASDKAKFGLSEVKIGLVPAAISPYVIRKIGESRAREYFLTGKRVTALKALEIGLLNEVVPENELETKIQELVEMLLTSGPEALASCKELIFQVPGMSMEEAKTYTAQMIAHLRISKEGQEGMDAFLAKRAPSWVNRSAGKPKRKE